MTDHKPIFCFARFSIEAHKFGMRTERTFNLSENLAKILVLVEKENGSFRVAPRHVA
jgi:hypothetical protein